MGMVIAVQPADDTKLTTGPQAEGLSEGSEKNRFGLAAQRLVGREVRGWARRGGVKSMEVGGLVADSTRRGWSEIADE